MEFFRNTATQTQYGRSRHIKLPENPGPKEHSHWVVAWTDYWKRRNLINCSGVVETKNDHEIMAELQEHSLNQDHYEKTMRHMTTQVDFKTSQDRSQPFVYEIKWLADWVFKACVDKDNFWKQLSKLKISKGNKNQNLVDQFTDCIMEV
jgi:hypothetical protein